ncbi:carbohydrate ABC transporter permease [Alphaproteobacteria bacterium]|mgnify:FL=1|jgi:raffinose/stachyose/melibiose transport system permease protein|nr:carbohydrate ABC transporter permease [Alphaproteobacteria bacterium]MDC0624106.1 carbohydrate ABC transporter permease [Alphaproteobacteria bacterium]MDC1047328.1 carbohydrate ABC transporter permease [Alphaproteobacteria bacterium]
MAISKFKKREGLFNHLILMILAMTIILPLLVLLFNSIKPQSEFGTNPLGFPKEIRLMNYYDAWVIGGYARIFLNSFILVAGTLIVNLTLSGMAAFSLAVLNPRGKLTIVLGIYLLVGISIPAQMFILPLFILWKNLYLTNTRIGLIIIYSALNAPFAVFLIRSYMIQLPSELFDAAKIDGANTFQLFYKIALPLSWPVFLTTGLVVGLAVWNEFLFALTFMQTEAYKPISTILFAFQSRFENDYSLVSAASIMMAAPIAILFMFFQRKFIAGLTGGGLKG